MAPTLGESGSYLLNRWVYHVRSPQRSDIVVIRDPSGGLIALNYESVIPLFGNLFFGLKRVRDMINRPVSALGWFRRKVSQVIDLKTIKTSDRPFRSYTRFWALFLAVMITGIGIAVTVASLATVAAPLGPGGQGAH